MENNKHLLPAMKSISLGTIFDGAVFSMKQAQAQFFCEVVHLEAIRRKCDSTF